MAAALTSTGGADELEQALHLRALNRRLREQYDLSNFGREVASSSSHTRWGPRCQTRPDQPDASTPTPRSGTPQQCVGIHAVDLCAGPSLLACRSSQLALNKQDVFDALRHLSATGSVQVCW